MRRFLANDVAVRNFRTTTTTVEVEVVAAV
jgi:hypothetical protein